MQNHNIHKLNLLHILYQCGYDKVLRKITLTSNLYRFEKVNNINNSWGKMQKWRKIHKAVKTYGRIIGGETAVEICEEQRKILLKDMSD